MSTSSSLKKAPVFKSGIYKFAITQQPELKTAQKTGNKYLVFDLEALGYFNPDTQALETELDGQSIVGYGFTFMATWLPDGRNIGLQQIHEGVTPEPLPALESLEINPVTMFPNDINYEGLEVFAEAVSKEFVTVDERSGKPAINPLTGKPIVGYQRRINRIVTPN